MIFVAGAGAMADAARAIRASQRELDRRVARTLRRARARKMQIGDYEPKRAEFACAFLCGTCDYFVPPKEGQKEPTTPCPCCGTTEWLDLALEPLAGRVRDMEQEERMKPPAEVRRVVLGGTIAVFALILVGLVVASLVTTGEFLSGGYGFFAIVTGCAALLLVPLSAWILPRPASVLLLRNQERRPYRWHVPFPLPEPDRRPDKEARAVKAEAVEGTMIAPISGRPCIAFEVCVLFDTPGDARPPEWVLQEQEGMRLRLGEREFGPQEYFLESPVEEVDAPGGAEDLMDLDAKPDERYKEIRQFLRQRGLFISDGDFHFFEARLEPGDEVNVEEFDGEVVVLRHTAAEHCGTLPRLPRPTWREEN